MTMGSAESTHQTFAMKPPFDKKDLADLVLRSSGGIDFYVAKTVLAISSPVFRDMASLAIPISFTDGESQENGTKEGLPVIVMHESTALVLDTLLRLLYPGQPEMPPDLEVIAGIALAAEKYDMACLTQWVEQSLQMAVTRPNPKPSASIVAAFLIARRYSLTRAARSAALKFLAHYPEVTHSPALEQHWTSAAELARLYDYKAAGGNRIRRIYDSGWSIVSPLSDRISGGSRTVMSAKPVAAEET